VRHAAGKPRGGTQKVRRGRTLQLIRSRLMKWPTYTSAIVIEGRPAVTLIDLQKSVCRRFGADFFRCDESLKLGISRNFDPRHFPINGLRHPPEGDTTGWYIWSGENFSEEPGFFVPWHAKHLHGRYPEIAEYLGLAPGWRFLIAPGHEDVWFDATLLNV
jgi:hypothetical protein